MEEKNETKRERFVRIVEARTNKIINMVRLLGNCANKSIYEYDKDDVQQIFTTLEEEIKNAKAKFSQSGEQENAIFRLKERK